MASSIELSTPSGALHHDCLRNRNQHYHGCMSMSQTTSTSTAGFLNRTSTPHANGNERNAVTARWDRKVSAVCRRGARGHDGASHHRDCEGRRGRFRNWSRGHARSTVFPTLDWICQIHAHSHATLGRQAQLVSGVIRCQAG